MKGYYTVWKESKLFCCHGNVTKHYLIIGFFYGKLYFLSDACNIDDLLNTCCSLRLFFYIVPLMGTYTLCQLIIFSLFTSYQYFAVHNNIYNTSFITQTAEKLLRYFLLNLRKMTATKTCRI